MKASIWRRRYLAVALIALWAWLDAAPAGAQPGPGGVHVQPPTIEAAVTEHWPKPEGCD